MERKPGITRLVVSGGKKAEPRLMMAHPITDDLPRQSRRLITAEAAIGWVIVAILIAIFWLQS